MFKKLVNFSITRKKIKLENKDFINIKVSFPDKMLKLLVRPRQIQQVFINLLSNARYALNKKYSEYHEDKILEISAKTVKRNKNLFLQIIFNDHGTGIPAEKLDEICNPFFTTKPTGEGTGLGLSISHNIIKDHDGRLFFESDEGKYTKAIVELPAISK